MHPLRSSSVSLTAAAERAAAQSLLRMEQATRYRAPCRVADASTAVRIGVDVVEIGDMREMLLAWGQTLKGHTFTANEARYCESKHDPARHFAGRLAAKEAVYKALGLNWDGAFAWSMIEIVPGRTGLGPPAVRLRGNCRARCERFRVAVSISHTRHLAVAVATATKRRSA